MQDSTIFKYNLENSQCLADNLPTIRFKEPTQLNMCIEERSVSLQAILINKVSNQALEEIVPVKNFEKVQLAKDLWVKRDKVPRCEMTNKWKTLMAAIWTTKLTSKLTMSWKRIS